MTRPEVLQKLLRLGPLEPIYAREICGWRVDEFEDVLLEAVKQGLVSVARHAGRKPTRLVAVMKEIKQP